MIKLNKFILAANVSRMEALIFQILKILKSAGFNFNFENLGKEVLPLAEGFLFFKPGNFC